MTADISPAQLIKLYRHMRFDGADYGVLDVQDHEIRDLILAIDSSESLQRDVGLALITERTDVVVGVSVGVEFGPPRWSLGVLAANFDSFLDGRNVRVTEPACYFVMSDRIDPDVFPTPAIINRYRKALSVVSVMREAAAYFDETRSELVYLDAEKVMVPVRYTEEDLRTWPVDELDKFIEQFRHEFQRTEKLSLLALAIAKIALSQPLKKRFVHLLTNLALLNDEVEKGFKLYISNFSYTKIRSDIETVRLEYISKIHKTFSDIQGQILGLPIATVVVATQFKAVTSSCGVEVWSNRAILAGAWVYFILLALSLINQWLTLGVIAGEISSQTKKLKRDYSDISEEFQGVFNRLIVRINWHHFGFTLILVAGVVGITLATLAFISLSAQYRC